MNQELAQLIERSAELKRDLVQFAQGPRFERSLTAALLEVTGPEGELDEGDVIGVIDRFALQHRLHDGKTVVERASSSSKAPARAWMPAALVAAARSVPGPGPAPSQSGRCGRRSSAHERIDREGLGEGDQALGGEAAHDDLPSGPGRDE